MNVINSHDEISRNSRSLGRMRLYQPCIKGLRVAQFAVQVFDRSRHDYHRLLCESCVHCPH